MRISDWSSDVCSSDLLAIAEQRNAGFLERGVIGGRARIAFGDRPEADEVARKVEHAEQPAEHGHDALVGQRIGYRRERDAGGPRDSRSEEGARGEECVSTCSSGVRTGQEQKKT